MNQSFFARRSLAIVVVMVFLMPLIWAGTRRALESNRNDVKDWLPTHFSETKTHRWFQEHFPLEQFVLVSWEGCTLDDPRLEVLARKLEAFDPNLEELGITGRLARRLEAEKLDTRRSIEQCEDLESIEGIGSERAAEVRKAIGRWESPFKSPVLTGKRLVDQLQDHSQDLTYEQVLKRLEGSLIGKDHSKTCLVVVLSEAAKGKSLHGALASIRRVAKEGCDLQAGDLRMGGPPVDNVAIDVEGQRTLYRLAGLSAVVGLGISWLCFRSYRLTFLVFFIAILAAGIGLASVYYVGVFTRLIGWESISLSYGTCDAILLSMPSLVYVLAMSGAVHIINYYHDAVREHGLVRAPERALGHGLVPCTLAALTTALGLGSLLASHLVPINKFGLYCAWGVMATLGLLFLYLPACLHYFPSRDYVKGGAKNPDGQPKPSVFVEFWHAVGGFITGHNLLVTAGCLAVMAFFVAGLPRVETSVKLMKLFSPDAPIIDDYTWLEKHLGPLVPMEVVIHVDNQKCKLNTVDRMRLAQQVELAVESLPDVGGALSAATLAPNIEPDRTKGGVLEKIIGLNRRRERDRQLSIGINENRKRFRDYLSLDKEVAVADEQSNPTLKQLGITGEIAKTLEADRLDRLQAIERYGSLESLDGIGPEQAAEVAQAIDAWRRVHRDPSLEELGITGELAGLLRARKLDTLLAIEKYGQGESIEKNLRSIPGMGPDQAAEVAQAVDDWRTDHGEELWRVSARVRALGDLDYGLFVDDLKARVEPVLAWYQKQRGVDGVYATYTGLVPLVYKAQRELLHGLYNSLKWAFVLIALVMMMVLRSPSAGLLSMIPNVFPVVLIFGAMGWLGILVDVGTMMTASVALGVAVDDTIHFLTWFRRGLDEGHGRKGAVMLAYERCGTAMSQTTLIGGLGLSVFAFSTFTPTQRFGVLMLTLLAAALVGDLVFLPALLSGPVGRCFRTSKKKPSGEAPPEGEGEATEPPSDGQLLPVPLAAPPRRRPLRHDSPHRSTRAS